MHTDARPGGIFACNASSLTRFAPVMAGTLGKNMTQQTIKLNIDVSWNRLNGPNRPYQWGDEKRPGYDKNWKKRNIIYRWVKNSTQEVAIVGETDRTLSERMNNYLTATPNSQAGETNKKVYQEQQRLETNNDFLYLEFTEHVQGYNLNEKRERRLAESLIIGYSKPYLQ